ncbi:MAG: hypothetical protein IPG02_02370 [Ignavibacteria bacterium]|nr:hypothetical protein [Ignavibacteria bacterium]
MTRIRRGIVFFVLFCCSLFSQTINAQEDYKISLGTDLCAQSPNLLSYIKTKGIDILDADKCKIRSDIFVSYSDSKVYFGTNVERNISEVKAIVDAFPIALRQPYDEDEDAYQKPDTGNIFTPITGSKGDRVWKKNKWLEWVNPKLDNLTWPLDLYVNPYFQAFGGEVLGIPIKYRTGTGLTIGFGTSYSGPMETDFVKGGIHLGPLGFSVTSRIKEFVSKYSSNRLLVDTRSTWIGNWNNLFTPHLGFEVTGEIPFLKLSYFSTIDTLDETDPPVKVLNEVTGQPMKNNIVRGESFGFEVNVRHLRVLRAAFSKFYFARYFGEYHLGFAGKEMKIHTFIFDFRINATFSGKRDFQVLTEIYFDELFEGFGNKSIGLGPSFRFGATPGNNFGVITGFLNMRIKIGDFFDRISINNTNCLQK